MPSSLQTCSSVEPDAILASACRRLFTICSGVCNFRFIWVSLSKKPRYSFRIPSNSQWYSFRGSHHQFLCVGKITSNVLYINFLRGIKEHFLAIKQAIEKGSNVSDELKRTKEIIEEAQKNPRHLCDDHICTKLGDALIAIDGLDMDYFAANNDKEWVLLSNVLGKHLVNPVREARTNSLTWTVFLSGINSSGNELFKKQNPAQAPVFKEAHQAQSPETRQIVAQMKA